MPTHTVTVTLTCDDESFTYDEAVEFINDHLTADHSPPGFGKVGKLSKYNAQGAPMQEYDVEWAVE